MGDVLEVQVRAQAGHELVDGGRPFSRYRMNDGRVASRVWRAAVASTGAPAELRPHDLRHHAATLTARMPGITTKELMARIGHASPRAALIYQHATQERDRAVASYLDEIVAASRPTPVADVVPIAAASGAGVGLDA